MAALINTPLHSTLSLIRSKWAAPYPEEKPDFSAPAENVLEKQKANPKDSWAASSESIDGEDMTNIHILVDWCGADDVENPRNWSKIKKLWIVSVICWYTFVVYSSSAIFVPADTFVRLRYGVSQELASLSLSMYVVGYAFGPMVFSPISEIAYIGRNIPYLISFFLYLIVSIILAVVADKSFAALVILRLIQGFFGSPILGSGGASLGDILDMTTLPYAFIVWVGAMYCGPALGPLISSYAVVANWRWPLWEIVIMCGPLLISLVLLPETSGPKILYERAARLRKITGDRRYKSPAELVKLDAVAIFSDAMIKPMEIAIKDPAIGFVCVYCALLYGTFYSFFEAFPIVYASPEIYGFSLQSVALIFLSVVIGVILFGGAYFVWLYYCYNPKLRREEQTPESRLQPALIAVFLLPVSLFLFAWSARSSVHWIVPTVGVMIYSGTSYIVFQCALCYVPLTYPAYLASLLAGADFARALVAAGFVMFSRPMYINLGIDKGVTLLAGLSIMGVLGMWYLYYYGAFLRSRSKFAVG